MGVHLSAQAAALRLPRPVLQVQRPDSLTFLSQEAYRLLLTTALFLQVMVAGLVPGVGEWRWGSGPDGPSASAGCGANLGAWALRGAPANLHMPLAPPTPTMPCTHTHTPPITIRPTHSHPSAQAGCWGL